MEYCIHVGNPKREGIIVKYLKECKLLLFFVASPLRLLQFLFGLSVSAGQNSLVCFCFKPL